MAEIYCKRCLHYEELGRALRSDDKCPACGSGVQRRLRRPGPLSHAGKVLGAIFSLRGIFFLIGFAILDSLPAFSGVIAVAAALMLFLGSLKLATKAMKVTAAGGIEFPEVSAEELFDRTALIPSIAFVLFFVWGPPLLVAYAASGVVSFDPKALLDKPPPPKKHDAADDETDKAMTDAMAQMKSLGLELPPDAMKEIQAKHAPAPPAPPPHLDAPRVVAGAFGIFLFVWAPMALVLFLRTSSTLAMFFVPAGIRTMLNDPGGYFVLCLMVLPALGVRVGADIVSSILPFFASPPILLVKGIVVLFSWGLCGLYVRQHARAFDLPVDEDDWVPHTAPVKAAS